jgi:drug/metabolite transporter superfamily protein YnfA
MFDLQTEAVLVLIALILGGFACWEYLRSDHVWTQRAKIWIRLALIFLAVTAYLAVF